MLDYFLYEKQFFIYILTKSSIANYILNGMIDFIMNYEWRQREIFFLFDLNIYSYVWLKIYHRQNNNEEQKHIY